MASNMVHENCGYINGQDGIIDHDLQLPEIDSNLLMSLLDELQMEEDGDNHQCDDERLMSVIQSLQAEIEIDPMIMIEGHDSSSEEIEWDETWSGDDFDFQVDGQDCSTSEDLDFNWMEMDDVSTMYLENCGEDIELGDYSHIPSYGVMPLEENGCAPFL